MTMARIPNALIDEIRQAVDIADVIGQDIQLRKSGRNLMGHCPFHQDDTPSFSVNEEKQFFYCFSCHRTGNVFGYLQQRHDLSFPEAVRQVAKLANIAVPEADDQATNRPASPNRPLYEFHTQTAELYHHLLVNTAAGQGALKYLLDRGMTRELIDQFQLGFAPAVNEQEVLVNFANEQGLEYDTLRSTGLFRLDQDGKLHDRFVNRVMYPIKNERGQVIAFSGRLLQAKGNEQAPKYLNSPETPIFNKRFVLFNLDEAKKAARQTGQLTLMEGFMDVISAYGAGLKTGIASMGTSFTSEQVQIIQRLTSQLVICYDGDSAGQNAIRRALQLLRSTAPDLSLQVVQMPAGLDPDEYVQAHGGPEFVRYYEQHQVDPVAFELSYLRQGLNLNNQSELLSYLEAALQVIAQQQQPMAQGVYLNQLASEFKLDLGTLQAQLQQIQPVVSKPPRSSPTSASQRPTQPTVATPKIVNRIERAEQLLLYWFLNYPEWRGHLLAQTNLVMPDSSYQALYQAAQGYVTEHPQYQVADFMASLQAQPNLVQVLSQIEQLDVQTQVDDEMINDCLQVLLQEAPLDEQIKQVQQALKEASATKDQMQIAQLTQQLVDLYQQQQQVKGRGE